MSSSECLSKSSKGLRWYYISALHVCAYETTFFNTLWVYCNVLSVTWNWIKGIVWHFWEIHFFCSQDPRQMGRLTSCGFKGGGVPVFMLRWANWRLVVLSFFTWEIWDTDNTSSYILKCQTIQRWSHSTKLIYYIVDTSLWLQISSESMFCFFCCCLKAALKMIWVLFSGEFHVQ